MELRDLGIDSDFEEEQDTEDEAYSADEATERKPIDYDIEKQFEIVHKYYYKNWKIGTIHHHHTKVSDGQYGRVQIFRYVL